MVSYVRKQIDDDRRLLMRELTSVRVNERAREHPLVSRIRALVPFDSIALSGIDLEGCRLGSGVYLATDLPEPYLRMCRSESFLSIDPLLDISGPESPVACWEGGSPAALNAPERRPLIEALHRYEVAPRTSVTLWRDGKPYGGAVFARKRSFSQSELETLSLFAPLVHATLSDLAITVANRRFGLAPGELACLALAAGGLTAEEIAAETRYTCDTVATYLKLATKKLGAANRTEAVAIAIRRKIVH